MASFVLTLELLTTPQDEIFLNKRFRIAELLYNASLREILKRYDRYLKSHKRKVMIKNKYKNLPNRLASLKRDFGVSEYSLHSFIKDMQKKFSINIDSTVAQKIATRAFKAFQRKVKGEAKRVNFKSKGDLTSFEGKTNKSGIYLINDTDLLEGENDINFDNFQLVVGTKVKKFISVKIKNKDTYAQVAIQSKVKFCRILRKYIRNKVRYYVQLVLEGTPPLKDRTIGKGEVGIDDGTSSMAVVSDSEAKLLELAPQCFKYERLKRIIQRRMDRSLRINNPQNYNEDGTIKKGKKTWIKSNRYLKDKAKLRNINRLLKVYRTISHNKMTNEILKLGDVFKTEDVSYKGLAKKSKETKISEKTGKILSKKRYGKSIGNRGPAEFLAILERKLSYFGKKLHYINTKISKCSQYDHTSDEYNKKGVNVRMHVLSNGKLVQRDLYSGFLIKNVNISTNKINRKKCINDYDNFISLHDKEIERLKDLKANNIKLLSSFGI